MKYIGDKQEINRSSTRRAAQLPGARGKEMLAEYAQSTY